MLLAISLLGIPGGPELIIILFFILLMFGGRKIPELMKGLGKGIREFNSAKATIESEIKDGMKPDKPKQQTKAPDKPDEEII